MARQAACCRRCEPPGLPGCLARSAEGFPHSWGWGRYESDDGVRAVRALPRRPFQFRRAESGHLRRALPPPGPRCQGRRDGGRRDRTVLVFESPGECRTTPSPPKTPFDRARPEPAVAGHVRVAWDAVDAWFEEDEQVYVHVRDPYHRIDVVPTHRHVVISLDGPDGAVRARRLDVDVRPPRDRAASALVRTPHGCPVRIARSQCNRDALRV